MTINYTTLLGLAQPVTGTETGQWGDVVNDEITSLLEDAVANAATFSVTSGNVTLTTTNGTSNQARMSTLIITGTPGTTRNVIAPSQAKIYVVLNQSDSSVVIKGAATTGVTLAAGAKTTVVWNGSDFVEASTVSGQTILGNLTVNGNTTLGDAAGDTITINGATTFANVNPTLSAGTANGVAYLNGSKVLTTGSALTYDGTTFGAKGSGQIVAVESTGDYSASGAGFIRFKDSTGNRGYVGFGGTSNLMTLSNTVASANLNFELAGSEIARLTSTGLGIGTSSPAAKLVSSGSSSTNFKALILRNGDGTTGSSASIDFEASSGTEGAEASMAGRIAGVRTGSGTSGALTFSTTNAGTLAERVRIDSSGNLGLGVTPSAWGTARRALEIGGDYAYVMGAAAPSIEVLHNAYFNGTNWIYKNSTAATRYNQGAGAHSWFIAPSGTAGNAISFTQAMTLDASGNLGIGTSSPSSSLHITSTTPIITLTDSDTGANSTISASSGEGSLFISADANNVSGNTSMRFLTDGTERARIDSSGNLGLGVTPSAWSVGKAFEMRNAGNGLFTNGAGEMLVTANTYYDGAWRYGTTGAYAAQYICGNTNGTHIWKVASSSGTAGTAISFTQAMTLDASGNLGIGTTSPGARLHATSTSANQSLFEYTTTTLSTPVSSATVRSTGNLSVGAGAGIDFVLREGATDYTGARITTVRTDTSNNQALAFYTGGASAPTEKARIDSSGNFGIGTSSPSRRLSLDNGASTAVWSGYQQSGTERFVVGLDSGGNPTLLGTTSQSMVFGTNNTERARIDSSGVLLVGATSNVYASSKLYVAGDQTGGGAGVATIMNTSASGADASPPLIVQKTMSTTSSSARFVQFYADGQSVPMGGIVGNGASNVQFATLSDVREKTNIQSISGSLAKINALRPVEFDWIADGSHVKAGFVAQEVETVFPEFVVENMANEGQEARKGLTGGMTGGIVAHLVKAIQEQQAIIDQLKARLDAANL